MYSSEDLERFYFQYQTEALSHGESLQSFCLKHKVPYNIFQKWYKDNFTDMRCKHSRVLSIIRERLHREPNDGDVFIVMSRNRRIVRMFSFDNRSYSLFEKKFVAGYQFMKVERNGADTFYRIDWKDVVLIPENPDPDREREKEDYDGTDGTLRTDSVGGSQSRDTKEEAKKERDLSNRPDGYKTGIKRWGWLENRLNILPI